VLMGDVQVDSSLGYRLAELLHRNTIASRNAIHIETCERMGRSLRDLPGRRTQRAGQPYAMPRNIALRVTCTNAELKLFLVKDQSAQR
jgi:hypothetical protein